MKHQDYTIQEFCDQHSACREGRKWALANCSDMHDAWAKATPEWLLWIATRKGVLSDKDLRLFACRCARKVLHLANDPRSTAAVEVAERHAVDVATDQELSAAWAAARDAARAAAGAAAWAALAPTVATLQESALDLVHRMLEVTE